MEIKISGTPKEIADLVLELHDRLTSDLRGDLNELAKAVARGGKTTENQNCNSDKVDFAAAQKIITEASKKVHEENIPKYETREIHIFCGNTTDSNSKNQPVKERTFEDVKRHFQKMLELIKTTEGSETLSPFRKD